MHSSLLLGAVLIAGLWRLTWQPGRSPLTVFVAPPLLLLSTVLAIVLMGSSGQMWGWPTGWAGYVPALAVMGVALLSALWQWLAGWWAVRQLVAIATLETVAAEPVYVVTNPAVFAAQIGIISPRLMLTTGLQQLLSPEQQAAVIWHERAHRHYRDSLLFFALGWLRWWTLWLPHTEALWQALLLWRELRADRWAAQYVDPLLLAETLVTVVRAPLEVASPHGAIAFQSAVAFDGARLSTRVEALLAPIPAPPKPEPTLGWGVSLALGVPLLSLLFHGH